MLFQTTNLSSPVPITLTANGVYTEPNGLGYSPVTVNVSGGGTNIYALIKAHYPVGQSCTCTNGTFTLTSPDTSGLCFFGLPAIGAWTITSGQYTASHTATQYEIADVYVNGIDQLKADCLLTNYARISNAVNDTVSCYGRYFTRNTNEAILICPYQTDYNGYTVFSKNNSIDITYSQYGNLTEFAPFTPTGGNQIYVARMASPWYEIRQTEVTLDGTYALLGFDAVWNGSNFVGTYASALETLAKRYSLT